MKVALVGLLVGTLWGIPSAFAADWKSLNEEEDHIRYIDKDSIKRKGDIRIAWELANYKAPKTAEGKTYRSLKILKEYDCKDEMIRTTYIAAYSDEMGNGSIVSSGKTSSQWNPAIPETVGEFALKVLCGA